MNVKISSKHIVAIIAVIGAAVVAYSGHDGWGWLIFVALCCL